VRGEGLPDDENSEADETGLVIIFIHYYYNFSLNFLNNITLGEFFYTNYSRLECYNVCDFQYGLTRTNMKLNGLIRASL
jgi:hypothetical protein